MKCTVRDGYFYGQQITVNRTEKMLKMYGPGEEVEIPDGSPLPHQLEIKPEVEEQEPEEETPETEEVLSEESEADSNE